MIRKTTIKFFLFSLLFGFTVQVQARIDDDGLEKMRAFAAQEQGVLIYNGVISRNYQVALPSERDDEKFKRSRKILQSEMQHWDSRIRIITSWPQDQAVRAISDGFMEIVDLGYFYNHYSSATSTRAEAVRRLVSSESEKITTFIDGMAEFEQRFYANSGSDLKDSFTSMKYISIAYVKEIVRFLDNRKNRALLDLYNENRNAYLNRQKSRYAEAYLEAVESIIDFERETHLNAADADPRTIAVKLSSYNEKVEEVKDLLEPYLKEQRKRGNNQHADRLQQGFDALLEDFENAKSGFKYKFPDVAKKERL